MNDNNTYSDRLTRLESRLESVEEKVDRNYIDQVKFHDEVLIELRSLSNERVQIATLKEKIRSLEKITWTALAAGMAAMVKVFVDLVTR